MKRYEAPIVEITKIDNKDILTASVGELRDAPDVNLSW